MQFASLASLWFGLALPAIIVMYLFKRKYIDREISSHLLWSRVLKDIEANRPWQKLRNRLLMYIQLLAAALLVLALMQPFVWSDSLHAEHTVIVLDRSASMQALTGGDNEEAQGQGAQEGLTRLELAKQRIMEHIRSAPRSIRYTILTMGGQPEMIASGESDRDELEKALGAVKPFYGKTHYREAMSLAAALTADDSDAEIILYTDGQWADQTEGMNFKAPVIVKSLDRPKEVNVSVIRLGVKREASGAELAKPVSGVATFKNWGSVPVSFEASIYAGETLEQVKKVALQPEEQATIYFEQLGAAEYYRVVADADDALRQDNQAYAFPENNQDTVALMISGGNLFLEKALQLAGVTVIKTQQDSGGNWVVPRSEFDFIVVDGADNAGLQSSEWKQLLASHPVWYIRSGMTEQGVVSPGTKYTMEDHPVTKYLHFQDVHIAQSAQAAPPEGAQAVVRAGANPLVFAGTVDGLPKLWFTFHLHHSDLPLRTEFPILVQNAADWLGMKRSSSIGGAAAGEKMEIAISPKAVKAEWIHFGEGTSPLPAETVNGAIAAVQTVPEMPGLYRFVEYDESGAELRSRYLDVRMEPRESNLSYRPELKFSVIDDAARGQEAVRTAAPEGAAPYPLEAWFVLFIMIIIAIEWGVYQRGASV
jgi:hypothetical protein